MAQLLEALSSSSEVGESAEASSGSASSLLDSWSTTRNAREHDRRHDDAPRPDDEEKKGRRDALRAIPLTGMSAFDPVPEGRVLERPAVGAWRLLHVYFVLLLETLGLRRFDRVARARMRSERLVVHGAVPTGGVVLAANHYPDRGCFGVVSAILEASARPSDFEIVIGERRLRSPRWFVRPIIAAFRALVTRWSNLLIRIPTGNDTPKVDALRAFRERAKDRCVLVFPEGRMRRAFEPVRRGAGRWLQSLPCPTVPVAVFRTDDAWHVHFGEPIPWTRDRALADAQLGLSIASLLPRELAPSWADTLEHWRLAHQVA
ncbi:MAG: hypothetical protein U0414_24400 [Polyangiaceae bacterium]